MRSYPVEAHAFPSLGFQLLRIGLPVLLLAITFSAFAVEADGDPASPDWVQLLLGKC